MDLIKTTPELEQAIKNLSEAFKKVGVSLRQYGEFIKQQQKQYHAHQKFNFHFTPAVRAHNQRTRQGFN